MAEFKSEETPINASAEKVFGKLSNLESLGEALRNVPEDQIPADQKDLFSQVAITSDTISFPAGPIGSLTLKMTQKVEPTLIRLDGVGSPVPMSLSLRIRPVTEVSSTAMAVIDLQIPAMLKPMVSGPLNKMMSQFADMLRRIPMD